MLNLYYNKNLKQLARKNRNESTKAEIRLWTELLKAKKTGYQFLRQRPVLNYIADFLCKKLMLIIEVDGITHDWKIDSDQQRDRVLMSKGFSILRFTDQEVMENIEGVEKVIRDWIDNSV